MTGTFGINMKTFNAYATSEEAYFSQELPTNAVTWHPYLDHVAALSVFNKTGSTKIVHIKNISITSLDVLTQAVPSQADIRTISAVVGGVAISPTKYDSTASAIPSQVSILKKPASVTLTNQPLFRHLSAPSNNHLRALGTLCKSWNEILSFLHRWNDATTSQVQKITLREGQGITVSPTNSLYNAQYRLEITIKIGSSTYFIPCEGGIDNNPFFALLNGTWSGVTIEVLKISLYETWTDEIPLFSIETIDWADWGETITQTNSDSTDSLNASILIRKNAQVKTEWYNSWAFIAIPRKMPRLGITSQNWPWISSLWLLWWFKQWKHLDATYSERDIILREGKGIAIMQRNAWKIANYQFSITLLQEDIESGGGGASEHSYIF